MAHGLAGRLEQPDWPPLALSEVDALLRRYPQAGGAERILSHSPRPFSSASLVATPHGPVFVKRHASAVRDREGLLEEHRLIAHLAESFREADRASRVGSSIWARLVQPALADREGETVACIGEWTYEVHPPARGLDVYEEVVSWKPFRSSGHARAAGRALAQLHHAAKGYAASARKPQQLVTSFTIFSGNLPCKGSADAAAFGRPEDIPIRQMEAYLELRPKLREYAEKRDWRRSFDELLLPLYRDLQPWLPHLKPLWTHNDFHASNLTWSADSEDASVCGIIDFGLADRTNAVHDIANAIERSIVEWLRIGDPHAYLVHYDHLDALLAGYEELFPLSYEEARALTAMLPLVHCEFALSETDYFLSILHSEEKTYLAYEGYFLAHAQWFGSPQGRRMLAHLQAWADNASRCWGSR